MSNWIYALPFGKDSKLGRLAVQRHPLRAGRSRADHRPVAGRALDRHEHGPAARRTARTGSRATSTTPTRRSTTGSIRRRSSWCAETDRRPTATPDAASPRGPGYFNIDCSLIKHTKFGEVDTELRIEAFNVLNHPAFADPGTTLGTAAFGTITAMLANPACGICGTTERQVQLSVKFRF